MAMEISTPFPWQQLPISLQESILLRLPISALVRCTAASRSLRSLIRSPSFASSYNSSSIPQPLFLFFDDPSAVASAYDPLLDRCTSLSFSLDPASVRASDGHLLLLSSDAGFLLFDPFSNLITKKITIISTIINNNDSAFYFYPVGLISESPRRFKIVLVCASESLYSMVYDSATGEWAVNRALDRRFALVTNGVLLNGLLCCLSRGPDHLLTFDPVRRRWEVLDVSLPASRCSQVLVFNGKLMLVGGVEEIGAIVGVGVWELDWGRMEWGAYCFMPEDVFAEFSGGGINYFHTVDRVGMVCFIGNKRCGGASILMCDLSVKRWWRPRACGRRSVHAVEPYIGLVKP